MQPTWQIFAKSGHTAATIHIRCEAREQVSKQPFPWMSEDIRKILQPFFRLKANASESPLSPQSQSPIFLIHNSR